MDIIPAIAKITVFVIPNWFETVVKLAINAIIPTIMNFL